jgi:hypothetical protein
MILAIMIAPNAEVGTTPTVLTTEIGPGDRVKSEGYNYKKHYRRINSFRMKRKMKNCHMPR